MRQLEFVVAIHRPTINTCHDNWDLGPDSTRERKSIPRGAVHRIAEGERASFSRPSRTRLKEMDQGCTVAKENVARFASLDFPLFIS